MNIGNFYRKSGRYPRRRGNASRHFGIRPQSSRHSDFGGGCEERAFPTNQEDVNRERFVRTKWIEDHIELGREQWRTQKIFLGGGSFSGIG